MYLSRTTQTLLDNFRSYHAAMHARLTQARGKRKHGSQKVAGLVDVGRRLTAVDFVVFLCGFHDIQRFRIRPVALDTESTQKEPLVVYRQLQRAIDLSQRDVVLLQRLRRWVSVTAQVSVYVSLADLEALWKGILYTEEGKAFPTVVANMFRIFWQQLYKDCKLQYHSTAQEVDFTTTMVLSARCQCFSMRSRPGGIHRTSVLLRRSAAAPLQVKVPEWVAHSPYTATELSNAVRPGGTLDTPPRFSVKPKERAPPMHLQGVARFHGKAAPVRCTVGIWLPQAGLVHVT